MMRRCRAWSPSWSLRVMLAGTGSRSRSGCCASSPATAGRRATPTGPSPGKRSTGSFTAVTCGSPPSGATSWRCASWPSTPGRPAGMPGPRPRQPRPVSATSPRTCSPTTRCAACSPRSTPSPCPASRTRPWSTRSYPDIGINRLHPRAGILLEGRLVIFRPVGVHLLPHGRWPRPRSATPSRTCSRRTPPPRLTAAIGKLMSPAYRTQSPELITPKLSR